LVRDNPRTNRIPASFRSYNRCVRLCGYRTNRSHGRDQAPCVRSTLLDLPRVFVPESSTRSTAPPRTCVVKRPQANKVTRRRTTGATGHDEGNDLVSRSSHSCTRAPRVSPRHCRVSLVAEAHAVVRHTSRRQVSRHPEAAACHHTRHGWAATRCHAGRSDCRERWGAWRSFAASPRAQEIGWESPWGRACSRAVTTKRVVTPWSALSPSSTTRRERDHGPA